jgi:hypothetical protein
MIENLTKFDSVQVTTIYQKDGQITYRRGIVTYFKNDNNDYLFVSTMNSNYTKYTYGITVSLKSDLRPVKNRLVCLELLPCRIVLIEKYTEDSVWSYNKYEKIYG